MRRFFCAIVPLASISCWPASLLPDKGYVSALAFWLSPQAGAAFFVLGMAHLVVLRAPLPLHRLVKEV